MNSSTPINPFTVDLRHSLRPKCECESCIRTRLLARKDGHILVAHLDRMNEQCHAAMKQKEVDSRRLKLVEAIVAAATNRMDQLLTATNILRISPS